MLSNIEDRNTLYSLIRSSLGTSVGAAYSLEQIHNAILLGRQQGVSSVVFDGFQKSKEGCSNISPDDFSTNSLKDRVKRIQKYYQNRWKIEQLLDVSYLQFIWEKVSSICKWKGE